MDRAFGSPVASPSRDGFGFMSVDTPQPPGGRPLLGDASNAPHSPLLFQRTPGLNNGAPDECDSAKRFSSWMVSTSPYAKTPPTVSMSARGGASGGENTPPSQQHQGQRLQRERELGSATGAPGSGQHFQAWLRATDSASWTPRANLSAATPPPAPAPSPACTPMSVGPLPASVAAPAGTAPRSRPLFDLGASDSDSDGEGAADGEEASTTVKASQIAAATARGRAAMEAAREAARGATTPLPRAPAPSPACGAPAEQPAAADALATPMSGLGVSARQRAPDGGQAPSSPAERVIQLMMGGGPQAARAGQQQHQHQHRRHHTPSRLAPQGVGQVPPSPEQQVIRLMMQQAEGDHGRGEGGRADGSVQRREPQEPSGDLDDHQQQQQQQQQFFSASEDGASEYASEYASGDGASSGSGSISDDDIDVEELRVLCGGEAGGHGHGGGGAGATPISDIINMLLTPELRATHGFTPAGGGGARAEGESLPRVLFADEQ